MISDYEVTRVEDKTGQPPEFFVKLKGPANSPYENVKYIPSKLMQGTWLIRVILPD